jgi:hypothetical protein
VSGQGIGTFLLLKFPKNHTLFEGKTNHQRTFGSSAQRIPQAPILPSFLRPRVPLWLNFFNILIGKNSSPLFLHTMSFRLIKILVG